MIRILRRTLILLTGVLGIAAAATAPAYAALNHSEPLTLIPPTR